jgi:hypothetical protein
MPGREGAAGQRSPGRPGATELVRAIQKENDRRNREARGNGNENVPIASHLLPSMTSS